MQCSAVNRVMADSTVKRVTEQLPTHPLIQLLMRGILRLRAKGENDSSAHSWQLDRAKASVPHNGMSYRWLQPHGVFCG